MEMNDTKITMSDETETITGIHTGMFSFDFNRIFDSMYVHGPISRSFEFEDPFFEESKNIHISTSNLESEDEAWDTFPENPPKGVRFIVDLMSLIPVDEFDTDYLRMYVWSNAYMIEEIQQVFNSNIDKVPDEKKNEVIATMFSDHLDSVNRPAYNLLPTDDREVASHHIFTDNDNDISEGRYHHTIDLHQAVWSRRLEDTP
jgi:hypothetical protein